MRKYKREFNVYKVVNDIDGKTYVGSTTTELWHRMSQHRADARKGAKSPLYDLMREYGVEHFRAVPVMKSSAERLKLDEEFVIASVPAEARLNYKQRCEKDMSNKFDYDEICRVYKQTESQNQTANIIGCSRITVRKALLANNIEIIYPPHTAHKHKNESA